MTAAALAPEAEYNGDGVTTAFTAGFRFLDGSLVVDLIDADGAVARQTSGVDYSVSGGSTDAGGTVTFATAPGSGVRVRIRRETPRTQQTSYTTTDEFPAESHEQALDRAMLIDQELDVAIDDVAGRALLVPDGSEGMEFDLEGLLAGDLLQFDGTKLARVAREPFAGKFYGGDGSGQLVPLSGTGNDAALRTDLADRAAGPRLIGFATAGWTVNDELLSHGTTLGRYGWTDGCSATTATQALQAAQEELLEAFPGEEFFYPPGPGEPNAGGYTDNERRDRRTGIINMPAGLVRLEPNAFGALDHPRAPFVGMTFQGADQSSTALLLETGGAEAWFFKTEAGSERYQRMVWRAMLFLGDDWRYTNFAELYSTGRTKQFDVMHCRFLNLNNYMSTKGTANADLCRTLYSHVEHYGDMLKLDNTQSVQHVFDHTNFRSWGTQVHVKTHGGGNVTISNASMDLTWDERVSPPGGNFLFEHDADSNIGQGHCTYKWDNCRIEVEAYMTSAGAPPFGLVKTVDNLNANPLVTIQNTNFVNGQTYTFDAVTGVISGSEYRRITAIQMWPRKRVDIKGGQLLKTFFYEFAGSRNTTSPNSGGIVMIEGARDGINGELPAADAALRNIHQRATYAAGAGRLITRASPADHSTGSSTIRRVLDADPRWRYAFSGEPTSQTLEASWKHALDSWPQVASSGFDLYIELLAGVVGARLEILKLAEGVSANAYQLHFGTSDKATTLFSSAGGLTVSDEHSIDEIVSLSPGTYRLWATGAGADFRTEGWAILHYK